MPQGSFNKAFSLGGYSFSNGAVAGATFDGVVVIEATLAAGKTVTSWVKTDADTAACDLPSGHGYSNGNFDVFWSSGGVNYCRYGVPGTISTNALSLDGGAGDDFPASATSGVVVTKQTSITCNIDGDNVVLFGVFFRNSLDTDATASADFQDATPASIEQFDLIAVDDNADGMQHSYQQTAARALLTGNVITSVKASNGSASASGTLYVLCGQDATP